MRRFAGYDVGEFLGAGGFGTVFRARDGASGQELALKMMSAAMTPKQAERFRREGELTASGRIARWAIGLQHRGLETAG